MSLPRSYLRRLEFHGDHHIARWRHPREGTTGSAHLPFRYALRELIRCGWHTGGLLAKRSIHQPAENVGRWISFADGTTAMVYRETVIDRPHPSKPAVLVVCFRLRRVKTDRAHALFRLESELNTILFAGFPGLISKLWLAHDENRLYRGLYQWDDPDLAVSYAWALWWMLALVSEPESIQYKVLPGVWREQLLTVPERIDDKAKSGACWWLPVAAKKSHRRPSAVV